MSKKKPTDYLINGKFTPDMNRLRRYAKAAGLDPDKVVVSEDPVNRKLLMNSPGAKPTSIDIDDILNMKDQWADHAQDALRVLTEQHAYAAAAAKEQAMVDRLLEPVIRELRAINDRLEKLEGAVTNSFYFGESND